VQAIATLRCILEKSADHIPHRSTTLPTGESVVTKTLLSSFKWKDTLPALNSINSCLELKHISKSGLNRIVNTSFPEYEKKRDGDNFARCGECDRLKSLQASSTRGSHVEELWDTKLNEHNTIARAHQELYCANRNLFISVLEKVLTIIHDKMDHSKTTSLQFSHKNKSTEAFMKLLVSVTGMIAHGHGDIRYAHYGLDLYPANSNHIVGSLAKVLRDLEDVLKFVSRQVFLDTHASPLFDALLEGERMCNSSLLPSQSSYVVPRSLPPVLHLQLDNACSNNKNRYTFYFFSLLVANAVFWEVYVNFMLVGHTYEDIDALFGRWSMRLRKHDYPIVPLLMKSFMDGESIPVIPHLFEKVPDFKGFIDNCICKKGEALEGHTTAQAFKFYKNPNGWPLM
jgi:hypothetical protein